MAAAEVDYFERFFYFLVVFFNFFAEDGNVLVIVFLLDVVRFQVRFVELGRGGALNCAFRSSHPLIFTLPCPVQLHSKKSIIK